jgi:hypothetical protein
MQEAHGHDITARANMLFVSISSPLDAPMAVHTASKKDRRAVAINISFMKLPRF